MLCASQLPFLVMAVYHLSAFFFVYKTEIERKFSFYLAPFLLWSSPIGRIMEAFKSDRERVVDFHGQVPAASVSWPISSIFGAR